MLTGCDAAPPAAETAETTVPPAAKTDPAQLANIFETTCLHCHDGQVPKAPHQVTFQMMSADQMLQALTTGAMRENAADLSEQQKRDLAEYLSGSKLGGAGLVPVKMCEGGAGFNLSLPVTQTSWGMDAANSRFVPTDVAQMTAEDIPHLKLAWAFAYPGATRARSQPTLAGGNVYVGSQDGTIYALDQATGCARWTFSADAEVRSAISVTPWTAEDTSAPLAFFGDFTAQVYAVDAGTGRLLWKVRVDDHPDAIITGSPKLHNGVLYVPVSSNEWASAGSPDYECCSFQGAVVALDAATGQQMWKTRIIDERPAYTGQTNPEGARLRGPAGAPVWNSPTIDQKRGLLYVGSGESYTSPAVPRSDSITAMELETGRIVWHYQATTGDAWNMSCNLENRANCPAEDGPDLDFGAPPILMQVPGSRETFSDGSERLTPPRDLLMAGQKAGVVHALNPENGHLVWQYRTGRGGFAGGVHWGMAADEEDAALYVPNADTDFIGRFKGEPRPGLWKLDAATGDPHWFTPAPNVCPEKLKPACDPGLSAAVTAIPGVVFAGSFDGHLRAYETLNGKVIWDFDTTQEVDTVSGESAHGGSIESDGPVIAGGRLYINSGYLYGGRMGGNVLLVFETPEKHAAYRKSSFEKIGPAVDIPEEELEKARKAAEGN